MLNLYKYFNKKNKMKKIIAVFAFLTLIVSCGGNKEQGEVIKLESFKDKLSYSFGAEQVKQMSSNPNFKNLDKKNLEAGFVEVLDMKGTTYNDPECQATLAKLFGPYGQDFDMKYAKDGSKCIGKMVAFQLKEFWRSMDVEEKIDLGIVKIGFQHALSSKDTLMSSDDRLKLINDFIGEIKTAQTSKLVDEYSPKMMENAKKAANAKVLPNGIVIQVIQEGTGASPSATDDVEAHYTLINSMGDTLESSRQGGNTKPIAFNLGGVIKGWTEGFQHLKKGGKYKMFVPYELAYKGSNGPQGALCFVIEFTNLGKKGTLAKPQMGY